MNDVVQQVFAHARRDPAAPAIVSCGATGIDVMSYGELVVEVERRCRVWERLGLGSSQRCGLIARQGVEFLVSALAILASRACLAPTEAAAGSIFDDFRSRCRLHHLVTGGQLQSFPAPETVDAAHDEEFRALEPAFVRFTSGTTQRCKGVLLGHGAIRARLDAANRALGIGPADRILWVLPMAHHFVVSILLYLSRGAALVLPHSTLPDDLVRAAIAGQATVIYGSPYHYGAMCKARRTPRLPLLRLAVSTASGLTESQATTFLQRFETPVCQALGIIEVGLPVINVASAVFKPEALGQPQPDYDVWLRAEDGSRILAQGDRAVTGEVCIRGPGLFDAYLDPWTPASQVVGSEGFRTGDHGWYDVDGDLHLAGRRVNRIDVAGRKFFAEEVEGILRQHEAVAECRVRGKVHQVLGEVPIAEVVLRGGSVQVTPRELLRHCRARLPSYKVPRTVELVRELPWTATGKLNRWADSA